MVRTPTLSSLVRSRERCQTHPLPSCPGRRAIPSRATIAHAVRLYLRLCLSLRDVEELLAERGVLVSYETIRIWVVKFASQFAALIRRDRPGPRDKWHLDEVVVSNGGERHWLWRAVDAEGEVLDILMQSRRDTRAAQRFLRKLIWR